MAGLFARGTMKPPLGAQVNQAHPLGTGVVFDVLFNELTGLPTLILGSSRPRTVTKTGTPTWNSNREGGAFHFAATSDYLTLGTGDTGLPLGDCTIAVIRRKLDTTLRTGFLFNYANAIASNEVIEATVPFSDGTVYWDYGGQSGTHRLSVASLSFSTTVPERWIFTAGRLGMAIWQNGVKVASQATAVTRTADNTVSLYLNQGTFSLGTSGDLQQINFFQISAVQWSDPLCRWWSAEPYAALYTDTQRTYLFLGGGVSPAVTGAPTTYYAQLRQQAA